MHGLRHHLSVVDSSHLIADQPYIRENMACALGLLQHNADEELWSACRDEHDECEPAQQGGSLMWIIALHRIQDRSEQALDHLKPLGD